MMSRTNFCIDPVWGFEPWAEQLRKDTGGFASPHGTQRFKTLLPSAARMMSDPRRTNRV